MTTKWKLNNLTRPNALRVVHNHGKPIRKPTVNANRFTSLRMNVGGAKPRKDTLEGDEYLVVPMVMITEGVHNGSEGPLYYPKNELGKTPAAWDHKPIVVYHPEENGQGISACLPHVLNTRKVGIILNTTWSLPKLNAEAWLKESRLKEVDARVLEKIEKGEMVEVSTGLFTDNEESPGEWNGEKYIAIARNYRPDHLAILPDLKGSCSIADGAGLLRNAAFTYEHKRTAVSKAIRDRAPEGSYAPWMEDMTDDRVFYSDGKKIYHEGYELDEKGVSVTLKGDAKEVIRKTQYCTPEGKVIGNVYNDGSGLIRVPNPQDPKKANPHRDAGDTWKSTEMPDEDPKPSSAEQAHSFEEKAKKIIKKDDNKKTDQDHASFLKKAGIIYKNKENDMNKVELIDALIANEKGMWTEADKGFLEGQSEERLNAFLEVNKALALDSGDNDEQDGNKTGIKGSGKPKAKKKDIDDEEGVTTHSENKVAKPKLKLNKAEEPADEDEDEKPTGNQQISAEEYVANAPSEIREVLQYGIRKNAEARAKLTKQITSNKANRYTPEMLKAKPTAELEALAALAMGETRKPTANFGGLGWGESGASGFGGQETPLELPVMTFEEKK